jgi:hypothetical protein
LGFHDLTVDDLIELLSKQPPKPADVTIDFLKSGTEPFLRSLQKNVDLLNGYYPARKTVGII